VVEIEIKGELRNPDDIFDNCTDTIECIKVAQKNAIEVFSKSLPHTKWNDIDANNREKLQLKMNKLIDES